MMLRRTGTRIRAQLKLRTIPKPRATVTNMLGVFQKALFHALWVSLMDVSSLSSSNCATRRDVIFSVPLTRANKGRERKRWKTRTDGPPQIERDVCEKVNHADDDLGAVLLRITSRFLDLCVELLPVGFIVEVHLDLPEQGDLQALSFLLHATSTQQTRTNEPAMRCDLCEKLCCWPSFLFLPSFLPLLGVPLSFRRREMARRWTALADRRRHLRLCSRARDPLRTFASTSALLRVLHPKPRRREEE